MRRFVLRSLLALAPVLLLVGFYLCRDPFHVVKPYRGRVYNAGDTISLTVNWGHVTIESFKYFNPDSHFDSFIFGSSLSGYYLIKDWQALLPDGARPFHFNATRESLQGIYNKLTYLSHRGVKISHALVIIEEDMLARHPLDNDVLFVQHPATAPNVSWWKFHQLFFNTYRHPEVVAYLLWPRLMAGQVLDKGYATTDITTRVEPINEGYYRLADSLIAVNPDAFFTPQHMARFRHAMQCGPFVTKVTPKTQSLLRGIANELAAQGTDYHVIIPPHYATQAIDGHDLYLMESIFGQDRVHDYSHDAAMSSDLRYYYDDGHLVARQCARLMDSAYHAASLPSPFLEQW